MYELANLIAFKVAPRRGPHRKNHSSVSCVFVTVETYLLSLCLDTGCITPLFYYCGRYRATAAVYTVTA
jgi:hypothetical protein